MVQEIKEENFEDRVLKSSTLVMVDFFATWCPPCKVLSPVLDELAKEINGITILKVNIDDNPNLTAKYNIRSVPTILYFKNGKEIMRQPGAPPKTALEQQVKRMIEFGG